MKKALLGAILLFSVMSCSTDETPNAENIILNSDLLDVNPNPVNSFIINGNFSMNSDRGTYISKEYLDGTFENIPESLNNNNGQINGIDGNTVLLLVHIDATGKASVGNYIINPLTNPDTGNYPFTSMNFTGNGYAEQERTGIITDIGSNSFTITYQNKYEYYSYISNGNKTATRIDKRTFTY